MLSDEWLPRYRLLENFTAKWNGNGNGNAYDRGDYNSSFALRAVELKTMVALVSLTHRCKIRNILECIIQNLLQNYNNINQKLVQVVLEFC